MYQRPSEAHRLPPWWGYDGASRLLLDHMGSQNFYPHTVTRCSAPSLGGDVRGVESEHFHHCPVVRSSPHHNVSEEYVGRGSLEFLPPSSSDTELTTFRWQWRRRGNLDFCLHLAVTRWHPSALPQWYQRILLNIGGLSKIQTFIIKYVNVLVTNKNKLSYQEPGKS